MSLMRTLVKVAIGVVVAKGAQTMMRAMIQATKADGTLDDAEQAKLVARLGGDVDAEEAAFVKAELQRPVDIDALVAETPAGLQPQIYAMSVLGIDLDNQDEAQYLHELAQGLGLESASVNDIDDQLGLHRSTPNSTQAAGVRSCLI